MRKRFDVFLSYSREDENLAQQFIRELSAVGLTVWFDKGLIRGGDIWIKQMEIGLQQSGCLVLLIGPLGITDWQEKELRVATMTNSAIFPVILPGVRDIHETINGHTFLLLNQWIDCRRWIPRECIDTLIQAISGGRIRSSASQVGKEFELEVEWAVGPKRKIRVGTLPNIDPTDQLHITWQTFEEGIQLLHRQLSMYDLDFDACFGINDAGMMLALLLNHSVMFRKPLGYIRQKSIDAGEGRMIEEEYSLFPKISGNTFRPNIILIDFEVKADEAPQIVVERVRQEYKESGCEPRIYFATFSALTEKEDLEIKSFSDITSADRLSKIGLDAFFFAFTMHWPGIEPPLRLR
jgi:hypothetical protein